MKAQPVLIALTAVNLVLLGYSATRTHPAVAQDGPAVLRGRGLEIVDDRGRVRASIALLAPTAQRDGTKSTDTVILRLITPAGRPSVKIAASETGAGMSLVTAVGRAAVILGDDGKTTAVRIMHDDGTAHSIWP